jgi:hypothetical protein
MTLSPCFLLPLADSLLLSFLVPFTYLETLLAVTGSVHLGLRLLVNWLGSCSILSSGGLFLVLLLPLAFGGDNLVF